MTPTQPTDRPARRRGAARGAALRRVHGPGGGGRAAGRRPRGPGGPGRGPSPRHPATHPRPPSPASQAPRGRRSRGGRRQAGSQGLHPQRDHGHLRPVRDDRHRRPCSARSSRSGASRRTGAAGSATAPGPAAGGQPGRHGHRSRCTTPSPQAVSLALPGQPAERLHRRAVRLGGGRRRGARRHAHLHVHGRPAGHVRLRGGAHRRRRAAGRHGPGRCARRPARRRLGVRRAQRLPGHGVRRRRRGGAQRDRPRPQRRPGDLRHAQLPPGVPADQRQAVPRHRPGQHRPGPQVLLRYVNVGLADALHEPAGRRPDPGGRATATPCGTPSRRSRWPSSPGATADTIATMPTGPEAKIALYEAARPPGQQRAVDRRPAAFAFGGMLTFLDTAAPPPSTDGVGPVSSHVDAVPQPLGRQSAGHRHR